MNTTNLSPDEIVPKTGLYYCSMCKVGDSAIRNAAATYAKDQGVDSKTLDEILEVARMSSNQQITKKRFQVGERFDQCPRHKLATGWTLESEEFIQSLANEDNNTNLMLASKNGHVEVVQTLLDKKVDVNAKDENGNTALMLASENGHVEVVRTLLTGFSASHPSTFWSSLSHSLFATKADVNAQNKHSHTALMLASINGHISVVQALIAAHADVNVKSTEIEAEPIVGISKYGTPEFILDPITISSENGINKIISKPKEMYEKIKTALMLASEYGHVEVVRALLAAHAEVNATTTRYYDYYTALMFASENGHVEVVRVLIAAHANINAKDDYGKTAIMLAAKNGYVEVVQVLLKANANVDNEDDRMTALMLASMNGRVEVVRTLLAAKVKVDARYNSGINGHYNTALIYASENGHVEVVQMLLAANADVYADARMGYSGGSYYSKTALSSAAENGHIKVVEVLLAAMVRYDPKRVQSLAGLALKHAAKNGHVKVVQTLITTNPDVNSNDSLYRTPLMLASENGHVEVVQVLLAANADVNMKDKFGNTALALAINNGHTKVEEALNKH